MTARIAQPGRTLPASAARIDWINQFRNAWRQYRSYMDTLAELQALTDRELADIGITRLQLRDVARDAIYVK